jgi:hypothetical protein
MVGTDRVVEHRKTFLRESRRWVAHFHDTWKVLSNLVDERNRTHIAWLKWLGCEFHETHNIGPENSPFLRFTHVHHH